MRNSLHLECFDALETNTPQLHPEYLRGLEAGRLAAADERTEKQDLLNQEILASFADAEFTFVEARKAIMSELKPILSAISTSVLPVISTAGLASIVLEKLAEAAEEAVPQKPTISVHPDSYELVLAALSSGSNLATTLRSDPSMPISAAWLSTSSHDSSVDLQNVIGAITSALETFMQTDQGINENGTR